MRAPERKDEIDPSVPIYWSAEALGIAAGEDQKKLGTG